MYPLLTHLPTHTHTSHMYAHTHTPHTHQVHTECKSKMEKVCNLGEHRLSILPPSALQRSDAIREGMWEVIEHCSYLSVSHVPWLKSHCHVCLHLRSSTCVRVYIILIPFDAHPCMYVQSTNLKKLLP